MACMCDVWLIIFCDYIPLKCCKTKTGKQAPPKIIPSVISMYAYLLFSLLQLQTNTCIANHSNPTTKTVPRNIHWKWPCLVLQLTVFWINKKFFKCIMFLSVFNIYFVLLSPFDHVRVNNNGIAHSKLFG